MLTYNDWIAWAVCVFFHEEPNTFLAYLFEVPSGVFADRMGRKYTLIAGGLIAARFGFRLTIALAAGIIPLVFTAGGLPARQHSQQKYDLPQPVGAYLAEYDVNEEIRR